VTHVSRREIVDALRDCLSVAKARRAQYRAPMLPLRGEAKDEKQSGDVVAMLRNGQCVAMSATFVQEIVNMLGDDRHFESLPTAEKQRLLRITPRITQ